MMGMVWPTLPALASDARQAIVAPDAPAAIGPYSQAILAGDTLYLSGQIGVDPESGKFASEEVTGQTEQALRNLDAVLKAAGMGMDDVVQAQVFLADLDDFAAMNQVYGRWFDLPPARATVQVARLPRDARVEIMLVAVRGRSGER
ncbi:RidA family protein [Sphingosinicella rhizophila]|uniref:RidA family protein n=1 Tax=Sphingosinicella rhizophila TaxID=3050082 RepID=A0ABU3QBN1_9SPHN|nr:RidA family protein [Sphingosinicella sp. GR2756]MDT9600788.1 RidA family protein [Sphingosinicella sp. GR2756]